MIVRLIRPEDKLNWLPLWRGYLSFYKEALPDAVTEIVWSRFLDPTEPMFALVAEEDSALLGLVHYIFHRNTWMVNDVCYLEDLFTDEAARCKGVGRALVGAVCQRARAAEISRVYWVTHETNTTAQALYNKIADKPGFIQYRKQV